MKSNAESVAVRPRFTHASFFSGVGGMDIGMERAGWTTVSLSEIDRYSCAVLSERWPDVPNLGDITRITSVPEATLWTGGFPCQDLSVAGQRRGFSGERSALAFSFLNLVEKHRPEAFILENVPGLLNSNDGRDFGRLLREVGDLGYGWAYRTLDAQWFGVPQRRKRVFILALDLGRHPDPNSAGKVLAVSAGCPRNHVAERAAWAAATGRVGRGSDVAGTLPAGKHGFPDGVQEFVQGHFIESRLENPSPDPSGMRAIDGVGRRVDGQHEVAYVKAKRAMNKDDYESWREGMASPTLNAFDVGDTRATTLVADTLNSGGHDGGFRTEPGAHLAFGNSGPEDALLPRGLDSHRYRAIGNGVAAPVAEWIGRRLINYLATKDGEA